MRNALCYSILLAGATLVSAACSSDNDHGRSDGGTDGGPFETGGRAGSAGASGAGGTSAGGSHAGGSSAGGNSGTGGAAAGGSGATSPVDGGAGRANPDAGDSGPDGGVIALNDAQILYIIDTANSGEVGQGMIAVNRAQAADVKAFAQEMVTQHTAAKTMDEALAKQLGLNLASSSVAVNLAAESSRIVKVLNAAPVASFDPLYVESQVDVHRAVLIIIDGALIPQAQAPQLKSFLTTTRATVAEHLAMAEALAPDGSTSRDQ